MCQFILKSHPSTAKWGSGKVYSWLILTFYHKVWPHSFSINVLLKRGTSSHQCYHLLIHKVRVRVNKIVTQFDFWRQKDCIYKLWKKLHAWYIYLITLKNCNTEYVLVIFSLYRHSANEIFLEVILSTLSPCKNMGGIYCESILFRGAEISLFEDDGHIRGYLTSWIALPTK